LDRLTRVCPTAPPGQPALARFPTPIRLEHTFRLFKQTLGWTARNRTYPNPSLCGSWS